MIGQIEIPNLDLTAARETDIRQPARSTPDGPAGCLRLVRAARARSAGFLERLSDPNDDLAREWDRDHDKHVVDKLLAVVQPDFTPTIWAAFQRFGVDGVPAGRVAEELGLSENAVILAKSRVLKRLREEAGDLLW